MGVGIYKDYDIWEGLNVRYAMNTTLFSHYKNGRKDGIEKLYDEKDILLSEKLYQDGKVEKDKTRNPLTGKNGRL